MKRDQLLNLLSKHNDCPEATEWVRASDKQTAREIWESCERGDWMLWIAARLEIDRKLIVTAACLCARQSLVHVRPGEERPRIAIETAERWVRGEATIEEVREARSAAYAYAAYAYAAYAADA
ncbi:putative immunity protein, partial [Staphylococcus pseudintermedius]|uniref:putative immunity protein n=1 Tax=Staphylococcus pseudintermedius TaxID=283734 RepID=UPI0030F3DF7C